ncbi:MULTISPECIES: hypothetical protein [Asaia]|uniref:Uncharacterized protein n=1 Tax=Asaia spathodeae TaxID=657016 RepID=A0ABX2P5Z7_9PROT|nr:hypothetical protein [Asaia spathodeae]GBR19142.1 hypothetical protein AA105894_2233 [Asaia spathodeae NBRC 105894]
MNFDWQTAFAQILPFVPAAYAGDIATIGTFLIALAAVVARYWPRPADGSKWLPLYNLVNGLAQNRNKAANADDAKS